MQFIKKYWKEIIIVLLLIFSMNKCTTSCNRNQKLNKVNIEINKKDSLINELRKDSTLMATRFSDAKESNETYKGIATGNQQELINKINILTNENNQLKKEIKQLKQKK